MEKCSEAIDAAMDDRLSPSGSDAGTLKGRGTTFGLAEVLAGLTGDCRDFLDLMLRKDRLSERGSAALVPANVEVGLEVP